MDKRPFLAGIVLGWALGWITPRIPYGLIGLAFVAGWGIGGISAHLWK